MPNVELINSSDNPVIEITRLAMDKIKFIVDNNKLEVAWMGFVDKVDDENNIHHYLITDVILLNQTMNSVECNLTEEGFNDLVKEITEEVEKTDEDWGKSVDIVNKLYFWGHSHHDMSVHPSITDKNTARDFSKKDILIRGIFNKKGEVNLSLFDFRANIVYKDLPLIVKTSLSEEEQTKLKEEIDTKVKPIEKVPLKYGDLDHYTYDMLENDIEEFKSRLNNHFEKTENTVKTYNVIHTH